jgi:hypothetical protein
MNGGRVALVALVFASSAWADDPAVVRIRPVPISADGPHEIVGDELILDGGGQVVLFHIVVDDWDPAEKGTRVRAFQVGIDPSTYDSGLFGTLTPHFADCANDADCVAAVGPGFSCNQGADAIPINKCRAGIIHAGRDDYIFRGRSSLSAVDQLNLRWVGTLLEEPIWVLRCNGGVLSGAACYSNADCPGFPNVIPAGTCEISHTTRYLGSLALYVSEDASGTFTVRLRGSPSSVLLDENTQFLPVEVGTARVSIRCTIDTECHTDNVCLDVACEDERCVGTPNYDDTQFCCAPSDGFECPVAGTPGDVDGDGDRDLQDFAAFQRCFGDDAVDNTCAPSDMVCDCAVGQRDLASFVDGITEPS